MKSAEEPVSAKEPEKSRLLTSLKSLPTVPTNLQEVEQKVRHSNSLPTSSGTNATEKTTSHPSKNQPFDKKSVEEAFRKMATMLRKEEGSPFELVILENSPLEVLENHTIKVVLSNAVQEGHFIGLKTKLLPFLKEHLQNELIQLIHEIRQNPDSERKKLYTNQEKYDFLVERYPLLRELKDKLGFEIEW
ncbi:MAG: hypothetical protein NZ521_00455 [Flammeovirgaceae bacterium]|nr:hypothetical protein [Flammeovirgaceae bacterium]MDW8286522.1 hypothetical protein [Flammeovirgaceae bacterium]